MEKSENPKQFCSALVLVPIIFYLAAQSVLSAEPSYNGKALSEWMGESNQKVRYNAIQQIGTNGIPTLLDILNVKRGSVKRVVSKLQSKEIREFTSKDADLEQMRGLAVDSFEALGTNAEPAIPRLTKLLDDPEIRLQAARALTKVGPKGFSVVTNALNNQDFAGDMVWTLGENGGDPKVVASLLIIALKNSNPITRGNAADFLAGKDPAVAVPALISVLDDNAGYPRQRAEGALGSFGPAAKSAAPKLLSMYTNNPDVILLDALRSIDRDAAGQAETFLINSSPLGARSGYTRTLLKNGKELVAGGWISTRIIAITNRCLSKAELFDPATGKWTETGEMNIARDEHTATLLTNGKVLIVGGSDGKILSLPSAELYDSATGKWTPTTSMHSAYYGCKTKLNPDGTVLVFVAPYKSPIINLEQYDPITEKWTVIANK